MRVFVTGASGHIGSALVPELRAAGHEVFGLARSDGSAAALAAAGAQVRRGDLDDLDGLRQAAAAADGVIHLAYKHELSLSGSPDGFMTAAAHDLRAIQAMGEGWWARTSRSWARRGPFCSRSPRWVGPAPRRTRSKVAPASTRKSISAEDAGRYLGFLATLAQLDNPTSSARTREQLGWRSTHPGLLADLEAGYFRAM